jgi:hypothetical protein
MVVSADATGITVRLTRPALYTFAGWGTMEVG